MENDNFPLLSRLAPVAPPADLAERICTAVYRARLRRLRIRFALITAGSAGLFGYAALIRSAIVKEISSSSFGALIRLAISDPDVAFLNAKDFLLGLLESLPLGSLFLALLATFCITALIGFAQALRNVGRQSFVNKQLAISS